MLTESSKRAVEAFHDHLNQYLPILQDEKITDVMLNDDGSLWIQRWGQGASLHQRDFPADAAETLLRFAASATHNEITAKTPQLMAELPTGARLQGLFPPLVRRPCFVLRLHREQSITLNSYV
ncbi:ATPase, T2SS/T4P/T4SS family, partial [Roseibium sp.]